MRAATRAAAQAKEMASAIIVAPIVLLPVLEEKRFTRKSVFAASTAKRIIIAKSRTVFACPRAMSETTARSVTVATTAMSDIWVLVVNGAWLCGEGGVRPSCCCPWRGS